ncbi:MAG: Ribosomal small subunit methyltransferase [Patescibacteria group bacterium]|nr:Ribosomal small subunit methyltransferase [Patescibacteria group bacterium]
MLLQQAVEYLQVQPNHWYIDCTFGKGGHTAEILSKGGKVLALDWDEEAVIAGNELFKDEITANKLQLVRESFSKLAEVAQNQNISQVSGILFDFGTSTNQLMSGSRGFSFLEDGELDMRMDTRLGVKAKDLLAIIPEKQLVKLFEDFGGEEDAWKIAKAIKNSPVPIETTHQLGELVLRVKHGRHGKLHPATKVFQALRIAVNSELDEITQVLPQALNLLESNGHIVTISFHEGEDRIVKTTFKNWEEQSVGEMLTKKPVSPTEEEVESNPRSRSAKLRVFKKN